LSDSCGLVNNGDQKFHFLSYQYSIIVL